MRDEYRDAEILAAVEDPNYSERSPDEANRDRNSRDDRTRAQDDGLRAVDYYRDELSPEAGDRLDKLIRRDDPRATASRYLTHVADPNYESAFGKMLMDPMTGHLRFSPQEVDAVRRVTQIEAERNLNVTTGSAGQFAIPFALDPTILLSSAGVISPIRKLARNVTIATTTWKGVSSAGVTAGFAAEGVEATDNSPVLAQPSITTQKAFAWVPYTIEVGQDWQSLHDELIYLFADAKNTLEATAFLSGTGTNEPKGVLTGLTTSQRVQTATTNVFALADVYSLKQALPARFVGNASWLQHPTNLDRAFRFVGGNSTEPIFYPTRDGNILGIPTYEWSTMTSTMATTNKIAIYGDMSAFLVVDRIGMQVELVPHVFGASNRYPVGSRGLYAYWRVGSDVTVQNAIRYLEVL
jgi:HK97 family phage major capsid protein